MSAEQGNVQPWRENVERVREALVGAYPEINSAFREVHVDGMQALDALTTQIEERDKRIENVREAVNDLYNAGSDPAVLRVIEAALAARIEDTSDES